MRRCADEGTGPRASPIQRPEWASASLRAIDSAFQTSGMGPERPVWAAAGFVDTDLSLLSLFELYGTDVAERRMSARRLVEALDVVEHVGASVLPAAVHLPSRLLGLH